MSALRRNSRRFVTLSVLAKLALSLAISPCASRNLCRARHLGQHPEDVPLDPTDVSLDLLQRAGWRVAVEVAVEVDLVAHDPDLAVFRVPPARVDPGVLHVRFHLALEEGLDALRERDVLSVAELGVGLRAAVRVATDRG